MTDPRNHAPEGDERIRTAVCDGTNDPEYEALHDALCSIESNCDTESLSKEALILLIRGRLHEAFEARAALTSPEART